MLSNSWTSTTPTSMSENLQSSAFEIWGEQPTLSWEHVKETTWEMRKPWMFVHVCVLVMTSCCSICCSLCRCCAMSRTTTAPSAGSSWSALRPAEKLAISYSGISGKCVHMKKPEYVSNSFHLVFQYAYAELKVMIVCVCCMLQVWNVHASGIGSFRSDFGSVLPRLYPTHRSSQKTGATLSFQPIQVLSVSVRDSIWSV